jgi:hypothetical protein
MMFLYLSEMCLCHHTLAHRHTYIHILVGGNGLLMREIVCILKGVIMFNLLTEAFFKLIWNKWCSSIIHKILIKLWKHNCHF